MTNTKTCEFVSPRHPDKLCDYLADVLLDAFLELDPKSRVAIEIMGGHDSVSVSGEVTSKARLNIENIIKKILGEKYSVKVYVAQQSPFISKGVDNGGAGDQGIMIGYATSETNNFMPLEYELARKLCNKLYSRFPYDGKTQVTIQDGEVKTVVASFQKTKTAELKKIVCGLIKAEEYLINPAGEWEMGGFDADSGLSGRKIMIDNYGPEIGVGGGSFSGKDWTKVDRSGAYMARRIAIDLLKEYGARTVRTKLAYAIGKKDPVMAVAEIDGKEEKITGYDLSSRGIYEFLGLGNIKFQKTAAWGHFGREFPWG